MPGINLDGRMNILTKIRNDSCLWQQSSDTVCCLPQFTTEEPLAKETGIYINMAIGNFAGTKEAYIFDCKAVFSEPCFKGIKDALTDAIRELYPNSLSYSPELFADAIYERIYLAVQLYPVDFAPEPAENFALNDEFITRAVALASGSLIRLLIKENKSLWDKLLEELSHNCTPVSRAYRLIRESVLQNKIVVIDAPGGAGKTTLLYKLKNSLEIPVTVCTSEQVANKIVEIITTRDEIKMPPAWKESKLFCIDDIDLLSTKTNTLYAILSLVREQVSTGTVVLAGIDVRRKMKGFLEALGEYMVIEL